MHSVPSNQRPYTLVVGGAGFIGSHFSNKLAMSGGRRVVAVGRSPTPKNYLVPEVSYISGDAGDISFISPLLKQAHELVDLAYSTVPKTSFDDPVLDVLSNLPVSVNLIREAARLRVGRVLLVSSGGTVYGQPLYLPIDENHATDPVSPYGITKLALEKYALMFNKLQDLSVVIARPSNPFGPLQFGNQGQGFIGKALFSALHGEEIPIFGERGTIRDYIYIDDLVSGLIHTLEYGESGSVYNIGTENGLDNLAVIDTINDVIRSTGFVARTCMVPARSFDVSANILSSKRLKNVSGWHPCNEFRDGLEATFSWALSQRSCI